MSLVQGNSYALNQIGQPLGSGGSVWLAMECMNQAAACPNVGVGAICKLAECLECFVQKAAHVLSSTLTRTALASDIAGCVLKFMALCRKHGSVLSVLHRFLHSRVSISRTVSIPEKQSQSKFTVKILA